jgi:hypothetical protein
VARILREGGAAHDEQIAGLPALQVAIERAGGRIGAHDGAAGVVRGAAVVAPIVAARKIPDMGKSRRGPASGVQKEYQDQDQSI